MTKRHDEAAWQKVFERAARELDDTLANVMLQVIEMTSTERQAVYELLEERFNIEDLEFELAKAIQEVRGGP